MKLHHFLQATLLALVVGYTSIASAAPKLELAGYAGADGAISVLHKGESADPYFALQALLLAHDNGMDVSAVAEKFVAWLLPKQKPDGTFDRFCRTADTPWTACKVADADDALLALWMRLLQTMPTKLNQNQLWMKSYLTSQVSLERLYQPSRGIYMVSPVYLHGLFMDNLEVWSFKSHLKQPGQQAEAAKLAKAIQQTFWNPVDQRFLVSTQLEQRSEKTAFYPDHVAQVFPLLVDFPRGAGDSRSFYRAWMSAHRAEWLMQSKKDYPWGLIAVLALRQNDKSSVQCWLREAAANRHLDRWAVTDETAYQIVMGRGLTPAAASVSCN